MSSLKELRINNNISQKECSNLLGISLRSYIEYENNKEKENTIKYKYLKDKLLSLFEISENKGLLTIKQIIDICTPILSKYGVNYCYLFGSYSKNNAKNDSDIDLLVSESLSGLQFYELVEVLRENLHKKVDLLDVNQLINNKELLNEILKNGVKIYG